MKAIWGDADLYDEICDQEAYFLEDELLAREQLNTEAQKHDTKKLKRRVTGIRS